MTRWILIDGKPTAAVHALDRGLQFGDGVFETMAVVDGAIESLHRHIGRLTQGCRRLAITPPPAAELGTELAAAAQRLQRGVIKLIVTRGSGSRGYAPPDNPVPRRILIASDWPDFPRQVRLAVCETRLACGGSLAGIKHLNRLEQVLATLELKHNKDVDEGLMMDTAGRVIEATSANIFIVKSARLTTPTLEFCGVAGVVRERLLELAPTANFSCDIGQLSLDDVLAADEVFLCNSITGIRPVVQIEDRQLQPGTVTQRLIDLLRGRKDR